MRVSISHKFILGFIVVVASIVLVGVVVPYLGIPSQWQQLFTVACALLVGLLLGWVFSKVFARNISQLTTAAEALSQGDLAHRIELRATRFPDETTDVAESLNQVIVGLRELVGYIRASSLRVAESAQGLSATSQQMSAASHEVSHSIEQISLGAETQAEMVERSTSAIREMASAIDMIAASANKVAAAAKDTVMTAQEGEQTSRTTLAMMKEVLDDFGRTGEQIVSFSQQVHKIGKIVEVITGIAQKTNLLALNATIEAARAGEYGRGFAVVAEEISKLADSTGASAGEITELIEQIRKESVTVQDSMKETVARMDGGRGAIDSAGSAFSAIIRTALQTQSKAINIAELSEKQTHGASSLVKATEEISRVVTDNAAATQEVSAATQEQYASMEDMAGSAQDLARLAEELLERVSRFRIPEPEDDAIRG